MELLKFKCTTITPMFLGGALPKETLPELRAPGLKGALRYWWRAMQQAQNLPDLYKKETELFGGTGNWTEAGVKAQKSLVIIRKCKMTSMKVAQLKPKNPPADWPTQTVPKIYAESRVRDPKIFDYLAYGIAEYNKDVKATILNRSYFQIGSEFEIEILVPEDKVKEVLAAFTLMARFGGLGAKNRNGFGRFRFELVDSNYQRPNALDLIKSLIKGELCQYTAFSEKAKLYQTEKKYDTPEKAMAAIGRVYRAARITIEKENNHTLRRYIGLPITQSKQHKNNDRHGKPFFLSVIAEKANEKIVYRGYILFLPYKHKDDKNYLSAMQQLCTKMLAVVDDNGNNIIIKII